MMRKARQFAHRVRVAIGDGRVAALSGGFPRLLEGFNQDTDLLSVKCAGEGVFCQSPEHGLPLDNRELLPQTL